MTGQRPLPNWPLLNVSVGTPSEPCSFNHWQSSNLRAAIHVNYRNFYLSGTWHCDWHGIMGLLIEQSFQLLLWHSYSLLSGRSVSLKKYLTYTLWDGYTCSNCKKHKLSGFMGFLLLAASCHQEFKLFHITATSLCSAKDCQGWLHSTTTKLCHVNGL